MLNTGLAGFLKGADAVVLAAAKHLKLKANLHPIWQDDGQYWYCADSEDSTEDTPARGDMLGESFSFHMSQVPNRDCGSTVRNEVGTAYAMEDIVWCTHDRRAWAEDHAVAACGNEPAVDTFYSAAAILVHVPAWSARNAPSG